MRYALAGRDEACAHLADDLLRARLLEAVTAAHEQLLGPSRRRIDRLMGSEIDALKFVSSMTLFADVARDAAVHELPGISGLGAMAVGILGVAGRPWFTSLPRGCRWRGSADPPP